MSTCIISIPGQDDTNDSVSIFTTTNINKVTIFQFYYSYMYQQHWTFDSLYNVNDARLYTLLFFYL